MFDSRYALADELESVELALKRADFQRENCKIKSNDDTNFSIGSSDFDCVFFARFWLPEKIGRRAEFARRWVAGESGRYADAVAYA